METSSSNQDLIKQSCDINQDTSEREEKNVNNGNHVDNSDSKNDSDPEDPWGIDSSIENEDPWGNQKSLDLPVPPTNVDRHEQEKTVKLDETILSKNINGIIDGKESKGEINQTDEKHFVQKKRNFVFILAAGLKFYFYKMRGREIEHRQKRMSWKEMMWSWIGAFLGIGLVALINYDVLKNTQLTFIIGSFGASAVLIYGNPKSPLAQPRNFIGGHIISGIVGVTFKNIFGDQLIELAAALAVSCAIVCMQITNTIHPPGGATALIAATSPLLRWYGYFFLLMPVLSGTLSMLVVALLVNNMTPMRRYPLFWY